MPAPANDAYTSATSLFSHLVNPTGSVNGTNIDATPDAGLSEPDDVHSVWWTCFLVSRREIYLGTRVHDADSVANRTAFNTVISLFAPGGSPGALVGSSDDYANWERESFLWLPYGISTTGTYWIRIHGLSGSEGKFILRWGPAAKRILTRKCHVRKIDGLDYVAGVRLPACDAGASSTSFGDQPAGRYLVRYAGGTFRFGDTTVPNPGTLSDWVAARGNGFQFISVSYQFSGTQFVFPTGPNALQATERAAENSSLFHQPSVTGPTFRISSSFIHEGGEITLDFFDDQYDDNLPGDPLPAFILYRVRLNFELQLPPAFGTVTVDGDSDVVFTLRNTGHNGFSGVTVELELIGLIVPITPTPADVTFNATSLGVEALDPFAYTFDVLDEGRTQLSARLTIIDSYDDSVMQTIDVDLTPKLEARAAVVLENTGGNNWLASFPVFNAGYGPTRDLMATVVAVQGVSSFFLSQTGELEIGVIQPRTTYGLAATFVAPTGRSFAITFGFVDGFGLAGEYNHPVVVFTGTTV